MKETIKRYPVVRSLARAVVGLQRDLARDLETTRLVRRRAAQIEAYLAAHPVRKLQIGAGPVKHEGWLNSDLVPRDGEIYLDAREPLPFEDRSLDYVYSEHLVQHLTYPEVCRLHAECFRILKDGGRIRAAAPNLWSFASLCCGPNSSEEHKEHIRWYIDHYVYRPHGADGYVGGFVMNNMMKESGFLFDPETLRITLEKAGFVDIVECPIGTSSDPNLHDLETHGKVLGTSAVNEFETFVMEARKPGGNGSGR